MAKTEKPKKPRANQYEDKLAVNGSFDEVFKVVKAKREGRKYPVEGQCNISPPPDDEQAPYNLNAKYDRKIPTENNE